jgi:threonine-phosphate decarboxylase
MKGFDISKVSHGGTIKSVRQHSQFDILDFSASLNPFPPAVPWKPDAVDCTYYPDDRYEELRGAIARTFGRSPDEVCVGNGSIELIRAFCTAVLDAGDDVRIDQPTFGEYAYSARLAGALISKNDDAAAVRFICNPNNPTGALISRAEIRDSADDAASRHALVFVDEAFMDLADRDESCIACRNPSLFVITRN